MLTNLNTGKTYPNTDAGIDAAYADMTALRDEYGIQSCVADDDSHEVLCNRWDH